MSVRTRTTATILDSSPDAQARMRMERLYQIGQTQPMSVHAAGHGTATQDDFQFIEDGGISLRGANGKESKIVNDGYVECKLHTTHDFVVHWYYGSDSKFKPTVINPKVVKVFVYRKVASFVVSSLYEEGEDSEMIKNTRFKLSDIVKGVQRDDDVIKLLNRALALYTQKTGIHDECHSGHKTHTPVAPTPMAPTPAAPTPSVPPPPDYLGGFTMG